MTLKKMFKKICIALYFISKKIIKSCYEKVFLQPQKFVLCKFVLCKTVLAEGCLYSVNAFASISLHISYSNIIVFA